MRTDGEVEALLADAGPRLRRAYIGARGVDGAGDAAAEAVAWGWEHRDELRPMANPVGYLYRVGLSRTRTRARPVVLPAPADVGVPDVEPALVPALLALSEQQRVSVWLVHACGWTYGETADAMGITASAVGTHVRRALDHLRERLAVTERA